jgi:hypothetical protein
VGQANKNAPSIAARLRSQKILRSGYIWLVI